MPNAHAEHMREMFRIVNELPGTDPKLNKQQVKYILFGSFPLRWRANYRCTSKNIMSELMADIVLYMMIKYGLDPKV